MEPWETGNDPPVGNVGNSGPRGGIGRRSWEALRASFGFFPGVAMAAGLGLGFAVPAVDAWLAIDVPAFDFESEDAGRGLLETVATSTVAVAGVAFSVTVVAFTLASSQLSPRVLRTFRADRLSQATLALFLGTFIYCLTVLVRLGAADQTDPVPNLSITLAILLAVGSFMLFALFIGHILRMLQPSTIIEDIRQTASRALERPYPSDVGGEPEDPGSAAGELLRRRAAGDGVPVRADDEGYLTSVSGAQILEAACEYDGVVAQRAPLGEFVAPGTLLAEVWCRGDEVERLVGTVRAAFVTESQRTPVQDAAFPVRQLADIALKGLSPGVNDPTTAENAMESITAALVRAASVEQPSALRTDREGNVRFEALAPDLDDLVRLGFEQVRVFAAPYPVVARRLLVLLERIEEAARRHGVELSEPARQAALVAEGPAGAVPTDADAQSVRGEFLRRWPSTGR